MGSPKSHRLSRGLIEVEFSCMRRFSIRSLHGFVLWVAITCSIVLGIRAVSLTLANDYSMMGAVNVLADFYLENNGDWPAGWEEIESAYGDRITMGGSIQDLRNAVSVDFDVDVVAELEAIGSGRSKSGIRVLSTRRGWSSYDSNEALLRLLMHHRDVLRNTEDRRGHSQ